MVSNLYLLLSDAGQGNLGLNGSLPSLKGFSMLHILQLFENSLSGTIPSAIDGAVLLSNLDISENKYDESSLS